MDKLGLFFEFKAVNEDGFFNGYASVFNNIDSHGDVVRPGAFAKTISDWKQKGKFPPILWDHNPSDPIGVYTNIQEDAKGLFVEGKLLINEVPRARSTHALMKAGAIDGLSIGYITKQSLLNDATLVRELLEIDLMEISVVTFPSNPETLVDSVKSKLISGVLPTLSEFEKFLRESGFSKTQATAIAGKGLRHLLSESEDEKVQAKSISNALEILRGSQND